MTTAAMAELITQPGVYDIPADAYHADPVPGGSLSSSGARKLLPPGCPARFRYERDHPPEPKREFDIGHAAHRLVLGAGPELVVVDAADWRTKAAREARDEAHAAGHVPLLMADWREVEAIAAALREHTVAAALFDADRGQPERALIWPDPTTQVWRRALLDWLPDAGDGRMIVPEYKTTRTASPDSLDRLVYDHGYHVQAAWNLDGIRALGLADDVVWVWVWQEKTPPYLVTVAQPSEVALRVGRDAARRALDVYAECIATDRWPGYSDDVEIVGLPPWVENEYLRETTR